MRKSGSKLSAAAIGIACSNKFCMDLQDFDLDLNILKHILLNSMEFKPSVLNISVEEIVRIHNV